MKKLITFPAIFFFYFSLLWSGAKVSAQNNNIGIGTLTPAPSALLDIDASPANNKGVLVPRMTANQRLAIPFPANSLLVFDTDSACFFYWNALGANWQSLCKGTTGAIGATGAIGFIGATGSTGFTGAIGATGLPGSTGQIGATGTSGGPPGPIGPTGAGSSDGFRATINNFSTLGIDVPFNNVIFNDGGNYNSTTGKYTCPTNGIYNFNGMMNTSCQSGSIEEIYVNGAGIQHFIFPFDGYSVTLKLNAGDNVSMRLTNNLCSIALGVFSGYKVY